MTTHMSDPLRTGTAEVASDLAGNERDAKVETLLLSGLDHYLASEYEQAINVWTRVLFLDRAHTRARAYIERARSALAEQQRETEELLHGGVVAFQRGDTEAARRLLDSAVERGGAQDVALAFLARLNRLEAAGGATTEPHAAVRHRLGRVPETPRRARSGLVMGVLAFVLIAIGLYVFNAWERVEWLVSSLGQAPAPEIALPRAPEEPLVIPRTAETALERARSLLAGGHLHDALRATDQVRLSDPLRQDADRLKAEIQRQLLAAAGSVP